MDFKDKILLLQEYITLPAAAEYLSKIWQVKLTEADVLNLALDGHVKLSVYFPSGTWARRGEIVQFEDVEWIDEGDTFLLKLDLEGSTWDRNLPLDSPRSRVLKSLIITDPRTLNIGGEDKFIQGQVLSSSSIPRNWNSYEQDYYQKILNHFGRESLRFLNLGTEEDEIDGVWDLSIFMGVYCEIKRRHHELVGIPFHDDFLYDFYVESKDGSKMYRLREEGAPDINLDDGPELLPEILYNKMHSLLEEFTEEEFEEHKFRIKSHIENLEFPATKLPDDSVLVIRPQTLIDFRERMLPTLSKIEAPSVAANLIDEKIREGVEPTENRGKWRTGNKALCKAFGVGPSSMTSVRNKVKRAGVKFDYDLETRQKRLQLAVINEILAGEG